MSAVSLRGLMKKCFNAWYNSSDSGKGNSCYIYDRGWDDPEPLSSSRSSLLLTGPKKGPITAVGVVTLSINLNDKGEGVALLKADIALDVYDQASTKLVQGDYVAVTVHYIAYETALVSCLEINYGNEEDMEVNGTVVAHNVRNYEEHCSIKNCKVYNSVTLYAQPQNKPLIVERLGVVGLYRSMIPVPQDSFIVIEIDLWIHYNKRWEHHKDVRGYQSNHVGMRLYAIDREEEDTESADGIDDSEDISAYVLLKWYYPEQLAFDEGKGKRSIEKTRTEERIKDQNKRVRT